MKSIIDIIRTHKFPDIVIKYYEDVNILENFFCDNIPEHIKEQFVNKEKNYNEIIIETLNSHNKIELIKKIHKFFPDVIDHIEEFNEDEKSGFYLVCNSDININNYISDDKFNNLIKFYGYYISKKMIHTNSILICPTIAENANDTLFDNNCICYHFTQKSKVNSILKNGLRCKSSEYRYFPERIYLYVSYRVLNKNGELLDSVKQFLKDINMSTHNLAILKIDLNRLKHIDVYHDDCVNDKNSIYTYSNIPSTYIKVL